MIKKLIKNLLIKISRIIFLISRAINLIKPVEFKNHAESVIKNKTRLISKIHDNLANETYETFSQHFPNSILFDDKIKTQVHSIQQALNNDVKQDYFYLEFGVWKGESANFFSKYVKNFYAFDSFEGLSEDWAGASPKGTFNLKKKLPNLNSNVKTVIGLVENTLDDFLKKNNPKINFVHMDMDTYTPTKYTLEKLKPYLIKNAVIIFDELYNYIGWEHGEYKALKDTFKDDEYEYKAFNLRGAQVVVQIK